jgi:hypothetical protein
MSQFAGEDFRVEVEQSHHRYELHQQNRVHEIGSLVEWS